ncbi:unnamed protein product [Dracunculus medinensis]|uniref:Sema domain-containing protein n=1 Tax=Dracunculus medinensis TaxID=318479 RepID=A0A0N4U8Q2_DRAME|nr:unnamed protein product [Dracunculus medinensis]
MVFCFLDNVFSQGNLSYRKMLLDPKSASLYVGANGNLFKLWAYNINETIDGLYARVELSVSDRVNEECRQMGHIECVNGIRLLFLTEDRQTLLVCSSNAIKPQLHEFDAKALQQRTFPENVIGICSPDPHMNTTAIYVEWGNPGNIPSFYSGIRTGLSLDNHLIYRPPLMLDNKEIYSSVRTIYTDSKWLNGINFLIEKPQFVASLSSGNYVYFFFREVALEHGNYDRVIYSRVARLCKMDVGGKIVLRQVWTSFVKARLNCSIPSQFPFYFDHIQSVYSVEDSSDTLIYATLTASDILFGGSAVCIFSLNAINQLFDQGVFMEISTSSSSWTITAPEDIPVYRPGSCSPNSADIPDGDLHFAKSHLLMADAVSGATLLALPNELFTHIVVDVVGDSIYVVFVYSHHSRTLHKFIHWNGITEPRSKLLITYSLSTPLPAFSITILPGEFLYFSDEQMVSQYSLAQCKSYTTCAKCAIDPYCSWNSARSLCYKRNTDHSSAIGWVSVGPEDNNKCAASIKRISMKAYQGDALHLICDSLPTLWKFNDEIIQSSTQKVFTMAGGMVLFNVSSLDNGVYECSSNDDVVVLYDIEIDETECAQPTTLAQFQSTYREWCRKFSNYKLSIDRWQRWYDRNVCALYESKRYR